MYKRQMKCLNLKRQSSSGYLSLLFFVAVLPIWLLILLMFLILSTLKRLLSLCLRSRSKPKPVSFIRAPRIPEPISDMEMDQVLDVGSDAWEIAAMRRYRSHLETCLDYSIPEYDDPLA